MTIYIFADTETTGVKPTDKVVEVAWIATDGFLNEIERKRSLINPGIPIPPGASGVHGITDKHVVDAPTMDDFMQREGDVFGVAEAMICHNMQFDMRYIGSYLRDGAALGCTLRLARKHLDTDNHKLQTLRYAYELDAGDAHSALGDVVTLLSLFRKLCEITASSPRDLIASSMAPLTVKTMPFGKHKGTSLSSLPRGYRTWLLGLADLDPDLRHSLTALTA